MKTKWNSILWLLYSVEEKLILKKFAIAILTAILYIKADSVRIGIENALK